MAAQRRTRSVLALLALPLLAACVSPTPNTLTLVESYPVETDLDNADLPQTADVWLEMIDGAEDSIDVASFYASDGPALQPIVRALEEAAERGVRVRFLVSAVFRETYPEILERFESAPGIAVRVVDFRELTGGVMHAKYMLVDEVESFVGSANFDWRSLEHIQELGVRVRHTSFARILGVTFEFDWSIAGGELTTSADTIAERASNYAALVTVPVDSMDVRLDPDQVAGDADSLISITPALSPAGGLPYGSIHDLDVITRWIDAARESVAVQVLTYRATNRDRSAFDDLDRALRRAAQRGVRVRLIVADWSKRDGVVQGLQELARVPGLEVRFMVIPDASTGFVPFARVAHAKYAVFDGKRAWLGSSNWEGDYFRTGRNVGLLMEGAAIGGRLQAYFDRNWDSGYAEPVDPAARYEPRRRE